MPNLHLITSLGGNPARDHHALYLCPITPPSPPSSTTSTSIHTSTSTTSHGTIFHVTGTIATGMTYSTHPLSSPPESAPDFLGKKLLGAVALENVDEVDEACRSVVPPEKQFEGIRRIDKGKKLRRCQEWVQEVVEVLREKGVLRDVGME